MDSIVPDRICDRSNLYMSSLCRYIWIGKASCEQKLISTLCIVQKLFVLRFRISELRNYSRSRSMLLIRGLKRVYMDPWLS